MPRRRKRPRRRVRRKRRAIFPMSRYPIGLPTQYTNKLKFRRAIVLDPGAGSIATETFNLTSPYDPYAGIGGNSATGYDQLKTLFNEYQVIKAFVRITALNNNSSGANAMNYFGMLATWNISPPSLLGTFTGNKWGKQMLCGTVGGAEGMNSITKTFDIAKFTGYGRNMKGYFGDGDYHGHGDAIPNRNVFLQVYNQPVDETTDAGGSQVEVEITYLIRWSNQDNLTV